MDDVQKRRLQIPAVRVGQMNIAEQQVNVAEKQINVGDKQWNVALD